MLTTQEERRLLALKAEEDIFSFLKYNLNGKYDVQLKPKLAHQDADGGSSKQVDEFCDILVLDNNKAYAIEVKRCFSEKENISDWTKKHIREAKRQTYISIKKIHPNSKAAEDFGGEGSKYDWYLVVVLVLDESRVSERDNSVKEVAHKRVLEEENFFVDTKVLLMSEVLSRGFSDMSTVMNMDALLS